MGDWCCRYPPCGSGGHLSHFTVLVFYFGTPEDDGPVSEQTTEGPAGGSEQLVLDLNEEAEPVEQTQPPVLQDTLYLTIYAANERLDPVRVWSDLKPRIDPYWIEQGTALNFEFSDTIRIRGQYARMLLFLNGHLIENFRQEYFNAERMPLN